MRINYFWLVTKATPESTLGDICFCVDIRGLYLQFLGGGFPRMTLSPSMITGRRRRSGQGVNSILPAVKRNKESPVFYTGGKGENVKNIYVSELGPWTIYLEECVQETGTRVSWTLFFASGPSKAHGETESLESAIVSALDVIAGKTPRLLGVVTPSIKLIVTHTQNPPVSEGWQAEG
jgi:hypothetical protein